MNQDTGDGCLARWQAQEALAEELIPLLGRLYRDCGVVPLMYGRSLVNQSAIGILKNHRYARRIQGVEPDAGDTLSLVRSLLHLAPAPSHVDIGRLAAEYKSAEEHGDPEAFLKRVLAPILGPQAGRGEGPGPRDIVLYGFGRIGRLLARLLIERTGSGQGLRLRAVVVRGDFDLEKRASLLRRDSIHGPFSGTLTLDHENDAIIANGNIIQFIRAESPDSVDYTAFGIDHAIVVDNTGKWRDRDGLSLHLQSRGVERVLLTAPGKGDIKNIVYGINQHEATDDERILSAASCTTNAVVPILRALSERFGIERGHMETVHAYTNDQNLTDNYHKAERRGRSAPLNMVLTETGAAKAVARALPELEGKLTGNAIRVPIPNVSMAILNLTLENACERESLNGYLRDMAVDSGLRRQIDYVDSPEVVSSDFVGNRHPGIVDGKATIVDGRHVVLYIWYDNEFGYSAQVVRLIQHMAHARLPSLPVPR